jgi:hypothetical protein
MAASSETFPLYLYDERKAAKTTAEGIFLGEAGEKETRPEGGQIERNDQGALKGRPANDLGRILPAGFGVRP